MRINTTTIHKKHLILIIQLIIFSSLLSINIYAQGFTTIDQIGDINGSQNSGEKPQSKVWKHGGYWWAVFPTSEGTAGTYVWKLESNTWTKSLFSLSSSTTIQADVVVDGDFAHVLLYDGATNSKFITLQYDEVSEEYEIWTAGPGLVDLPLSSGVETATIDIDGTGIIWVAYESDNGINVRWSASDYSSWSEEIFLGWGAVTGIPAGDDICAVTAYDEDNEGRIGILWSNQNAKEFRFRYHVDGTSTSNWLPSTYEVAASGSTPGNGVADDHINLAVHSNGTIYAAVKTSYDTNGEPCVALLVRSSGGTWQFVSVRNGNGGKRPTRPIAILNENVGILTVVYTQDDSGDDIMYKSSYINSLSFDPGVNGEVLIDNDPPAVDWNNPTSTKQNFDSEVAILVSAYDFDADQTWTGVIASGITPTPVELAYFASTLDDNKVNLNWRTETEVSNYGFEIERLVENPYWEKLGFVEGHGNSNSPKEYSFADYDISRSGTYKYRLKQIDNDGKFEYSYVITLYVGTPAVFYLSQNYPNPFNPSTRIDYSVPQASKVSLKIYDMLGREVASLVDEYKEIGTYTVTFDASNLAGGIYFYTISAGDFVETKKMSLVK
jgi:hypothetical protein